MKKKLCMLLCVLLLTSAGCQASPPAGESEAQPQESTEATESVLPDTDRPRINIASGVLVSKKGEEIDLMQGVSGQDKTDGNITDRIQVNDGGLDKDVAGRYTVTYFLSDKAGNAAEPRFREVIVRETDVLQAPAIWTDEIEREIKNPAAPAVFGGAWYHKVVSSRDQWLGIETVVTLPTFQIERYAGDYDSTLAVDPSVKNLDNPSVYLGGHAANESDVGLSLSRALIDADRQTVSTGSLVYRPFWRYITAQDKDEGGYDAHGGEYAVTATGNNCFGNYHWKYTEYYYLPGDTLRMIICVPAPGKLQLQIEVLEKSTLESSVALRERYGWKDPENFISPVFSSPGHGTGVGAEFKRVNAIDQTANEGGTAIPTATEIGKAVWQETYLYRKIGDTVYRVPMDETRRGVTNAPVDSAFTVSYDGVRSENGGEVVSIHPKTAE